MQILHVITTVDRGGAEKQLVTLVAEQIKHGDKASIVYLKGRGELKSEFAALKVKVVGSRHTWISALKLFREIIRSKPDIIHAHLPAAEIFSALFHGKIPLVVSRHNTQRFLESSIKFSRWIARYVESQAKLCIAISQAVRDYLIDVSEWGNRKTIRVVLYAIPGNFSKPRARKNHRGKIRFLFVGRLTFQKDVETLLFAFSKNLIKYNSDILTIIGDGDLAQHLKSLARRIGLESHVVWLGKVEDVDAYYQTHDVLVLPSKYEGFGLVLLEAIKNELPIIAANNSAIPEVLGSEHPGLFQTSNVEALAHLLHSSHSSIFHQASLNIQNSRLPLFEPSKMNYSIRETYLEAINANVL